MITSEQAIALFWLVDAWKTGIRRVEEKNGYVQAACQDLIHEQDSARRKLGRACEAALEVGCSPEQVAVVIEGTVADVHRAVSEAKHISGRGERSE